VSGPEETRRLVPLVTRRDERVELHHRGHRPERRFVGVPARVLQRPDTQQRLDELRLVDLLRLGESGIERVEVAGYGLVEGGVAVVAV